MTPARPAAEVSVVLAGGGSAGHTSPLIATAHQIARLAPDAVVTAVGVAGVAAACRKRCARRLRDGGVEAQVGESLG